MITFKSSSNLTLVVGALTRYTKAVAQAGTKGLNRAAGYTRAVARNVAKRAPPRADGWLSLHTGRSFARKIRVERPGPDVRVVTARYRRPFNVAGTTKPPDELFLEGGDVLPSRFRGPNTNPKIIRPKTKEFLTFQVGNRWVRVREVRQHLIRWPLDKAKTKWTARRQLRFPGYPVFDLAWPMAQPKVGEIIEQEQKKALVTFAFKGGG